MHHPHPLLIQTVSLSEKQASALERIAQIAFGKSGYQIAPFRSTAEAANARHGERRILALAGSAEPDLSQARAARDYEQLPLWTVAVFDAPDLTDGLLAVSSTADADSATRLRLALERHLEARASERARGDLLTISARVCHDLRSPLNTIQTAIYLQNSPELPPGYSKEEITNMAFDSINAQNSLLSKVSALTEASAREIPFEPISVERGFFDAMDQSKRKLEEKNGSVAAPQTWPSHPQRGVQSWIATMWESLITTLLEHNLCGNELEAGWDEEADDIVFWIRASATANRNEDERLRVIPFHLLHERHGSNDFGPAVVHRLATLQNGYCDVDESEGCTRLFFALPKNR